MDEVSVNKETILWKNILSIVAGVMLILAIPSIWPYGYYQLLRWVIAGIAVFLAYVMNDLKRNIWMWIMIIVAILFNPLIPFHLGKQIWVIIDLIVAIILFVSIGVKNSTK